MLLFASFYFWSHPYPESRGPPRGTPPAEQGTPEGADRAPGPHAQRRRALRLVFFFLVYRTSKCIVYRFVAVVGCGIVW